VKGKATKAQQCVVVNATNGGSLKLVGNIATSGGSLKLQNGSGHHQSLEGFLLLMSVGKA
jgi:hypothetical protein